MAKQDRLDTPGRRSGWIDDEQLLALAAPFGKSGYGEYLLKVMDRGRSR